MGHEQIENKIRRSGLGHEQSGNKTRRSGLEHGQSGKDGGLYNSLARYGRTDFYPYHMPGHKRSGKIEGFSDFFKIDITEIDGFDNLHQAEGILLEAQKRAAKLYGAEETFFLVNGSTCGILAAVSAVAEKQDMILIARNCHKSVYHAALLQELRVKYLYPGRIEEFDIADAVSPEAVKEELDMFPECRAVVITSPTYEGIIADIREIARVVHERGRILIVDEAHGAHLGLAEEVPENAVNQGADIVIQSLHKTLPSPTQTALLHVNGAVVNRERLRKYLTIYQSSSPSYVFMAGMDACLSYVRENAAVRFAALRRYYENFMSRMKKCKHIRVGSPEALCEEAHCFRAWDICKLVISVKGTSMSGQALYDTLRDEFHLQMEMAAGSYVLAIMTIMDEEEGWQRLAEALLQVDGRLERADSEDLQEINQETVLQEISQEAVLQEMSPEAEDIRPVAKLTIAEAFASVYGSRSRENSENEDCKGEDLHSQAPERIRRVPLAQAAGHISGDFVCLYPPGIPLLVPGEIIENALIVRIRKSLRLGLSVQGICADETVTIIC